MSEPQSRDPSRLRALIVEDEWPAREYLVELLCASNQVEVVAALGTEQEAREALGVGGLEVDVVFMDIRLTSSASTEAGLTIVRDFAGLKSAPLFVLATALSQHAVEAFDLDVVDYLLKPFSEERVRECLTRLLRRRRVRPEPGAPARVVARTPKGLVFLRRSEVWAFEASERLTFVHSAAGRFDVDLSLVTIEGSLGEGWLRVHRNWVVNLEHVKALERDESSTVLVLGTNSAADPSLRVPIARDRIQGVRDLLLQGATGIRR